MWHTVNETYFYIDISFAFLLTYPMNNNKHNGPLNAIDARDIFH